MRPGLDRPQRLTERVGYVVVGVDGSEVLPTALDLMLLGLAQIFGQRAAIGLADEVELGRVLLDQDRPCQFEQP